MLELLCAKCNTMREPAACEGSIAICAVCGATNHVYPYGTSLATADDLEGLDASAIARLRRARGAIVRPQRTQR